MGGLAVGLVKQFKFDFAILGCSAIDTDGDLLDFDGQEIMVSQAALKQSRQVMVVSDHLKFKRTAPLKICSLNDVDKLFTDMLLPAKLIDDCRKWDTAIVVA